MSPLALRTVPLAVLCLAGCVNMSGLDGGSKYACRAPEGVACDSVSGTYANAVRRQLPSQRGKAAPEAQLPPAAAQATPAPRGPARAAPESAVPPKAGPAGAAPPTVSATSALRSQTRVLRLWFKPWEDLDGDLFDQGYVYVQVDAGRWQIEHVQHAIRDRYAPLRPPPAGAGSSSEAAGDKPVTVPPAVPRPSPTDFPMLAPPVTPGRLP